MAHPTIVAVANQKGGVGKTTTSINLTMALHILGKKVLLIDLDPQGNASTGVGITDRSTNIYAVLSGMCGCRETIKRAHGFDIIVSVVELAAFEVESNETQGWQYILKDKLSPVHSLYDYIIIDCPPSLSVLTVNALACAGRVLIPMQCEFFALEGLSHLIKTIKLVKHNLNDSLYIDGVLLTMYDKRNKLSEQVANDVRSNLSDIAYATLIPRNVKLSESSSYGCPVMLYDPRCAGSVAYMRLAEEIMVRDVAHV